MNEISITLDGKEYQIDIQKAKELGILEEKDTKCKSWESFCDKYETKQGFHYNDAIEKVLIVDYPCNINEQLTEEEAIAIQAFSKLLKLRRDWIGDWQPDWCHRRSKYCIMYSCGNFITLKFSFDSRPFSFPTEEMAKKFLECFKHLFEDCKFLI